MEGVEPTEAELMLSSQSGKYYWGNRYLFCLEQEVIYRKGEDGGKDLLVVPNELKEEVFYGCVIAYQALHIKGMTALG